MKPQYLTMKSLLLIILLASPVLAQDYYSTTTYAERVRDQQILNIDAQNRQLAYEQEEAREKLEDAQEELEERLEKIEQLLEK